ncbi:MAG: sugar phosphate isomerase/epimerase [Clostridia bacterium]|nr:sugar phosphate isomerase/epimerase [Clostridia bacterium]
MELSTSTNICAFGPGMTRYPVENSIRDCAEAGYRVLDINFCMAMNPDSPMRSDRWEEYVLGIGRLAGEYGIRFNQSHLPYYDVGAEKDEGRAALMEKLIERSLRGTAMLGACWAVTHPFTVYGEGEEAAMEENLKYFAPKVRLARREGIGIALENDDGFRGGVPCPGVYCADIGELIRLADAFGDGEHVGTCYDFGHANLRSPSLHRQNLDRLSSRLKAVHVHDNHGKADEHLMPFFGSLDWESAMAGLADIRFPGDLTFEIQEFGRYLPPDMKKLAVLMSVQVGERLMRYFREAGGE